MIIQCTPKKTTMIVQEILTHQRDPREELDRILVKLCEMVIEGQERDPEYYGMVASCIICPDGTHTYGINHEKGGLRVHAERAAIDACPNPGPDCVVVTTLSPCNTARKPNHKERYGEDCQALLDEYGIAHVYCGYKNPQEDPDPSIETQNPKIRELCKQFANTFLKEDYSPDEPPGPEFKPTMPRGTVRVDVSDVYDWYKLGQHISNLKRANKNIFGKGPPSTIFSFGDEDTEHKYIKDLEKLGLTTTDIDPVDVNQPPGMPRQKTDPTYNVDENFADGRVKGKSRPGRVKRAGASCKGSVSDLRARARKYGGEKGKMYHWCANMKGGKKK